ncbi:MAG: BamA/TamA family outer membrane protein [Bacteroidales bacterium]|nr:BamA/TamA family outer membrane protein [Bacteroidales bacterium]
MTENTMTSNTTFTRTLSGIIAIILFIGFTFQGIAQVSVKDQLGEIDYSNPQKYEIGGITVTGAENLNPNVLIMISGLVVGDKIDVPGDKVQKAIKKLWEQGLFEDIKIRATKVRGNVIFLNIDVKERPRLSKFSFTGVKKSEANDLRDKLSLVRGDVVTKNLLVNSKNTIKDYYYDKGYWNTEVEIEQTVDTADERLVTLDYQIDKNQKVKVWDITIKGNHKMSERQLKGAFENTVEKSRFKPFNSIDSLLINSARALSHFDLLGVAQSVVNAFREDIKIRIFKSGKFIEEEYEEDKNAMIDEYNKHGFRDAKIVEDSVYLSGDRNINIKLKVNEGDRYYFGNIEWIGNTKYTADELTRVLKIQKGDVYNKERLNTNLNFNPQGQDVSSLYLDNGYLFFSVNPREVRVENDTIDLEMVIHEGKQATIDKVTVKGNTRTNDHVVIRELRTKPGQLFSRSDIIRSTRELSQLQYFNPEKIEPTPIPNPQEGTVDIEYKVEEKSADQIELSGGWGYGRIIGTLGLSFNNFSVRNLFNKEAWRPIPTGDGQKLSVRVQSYGKGYYSYNMSFTEPWLGGKKPNSFSVSYYHSLFSNGLDAGDPNRRSFKIDGVSLMLGKRLTWPDDYFSLVQKLSYQRYELDNYSQIFSFGSGTGTYNNLSYGITFARNSIDQPIYPRRGSEVSLGLELTPPYSAFNDKNYASMEPSQRFKQIEYHKWKFKSTFYKKIVGDLVIAAKSRFSFLGLYNRDIGITPFERYYLGGDGLTGYNNMDGREIVAMRGYSNESLTPLYYRDQNLGGTIYTKNTLEVRYPVSLNPSATIYLLGFLEAGNAWLQFKDFDPFDLKRAAGVGMRVYLPMFGLLGIDWGYGFDEVPGLPDANGGQFHFSIGQSID